MERTVPLTTSLFLFTIQNRKEDHQLDLLDDPLYLMVGEKGLFFSSRLFQ